MCWFISALVKAGILSSDLPQPSLGYFTLDDAAASFGRFETLAFRFV